MSVILSRQSRRRICFSLLVGVGFVAATPTTPVAARSAEPPAAVEDGYDLWLRYRPVKRTAPLNEYRAVLERLVVQGTSPTLDAARDELERGIRGMLGVPVALATTVSKTGTLIVGTPKSSPIIASLPLAAWLEKVGDEGYVVRSLTVRGNRITVVTGNTDVGVLHGAFYLLRRMQMEASIANLGGQSAPRIKLRMLDHWDNLDRSVERGYAGKSLWDWSTLPDSLPQRYRDYARANASIGINGVSITNVNANARTLTTEYLRKAAALAGVFRPYGIKTYLTARFSAPIEIGGLKTADPLDSAVRAWWKNKADEIYALIPDFGGFVVKANSEGQPGPQDYKRTHADGANMLADAVGPHGGIVMWRAFVYSNEVPT
ncbi:MAG: alpha-glucuronidase family glycosyl hydrolase, partial [bacterium]